MPSTWTDIPDTQIELDKPVTQPLLTALRENPKAIAEGAVAAPRIKPVVMYLEEQKPSGTNGDNSTANDWTRRLNLLVSNDINGASFSVADKQFTLPAGEYEVDGTGGLQGGTGGTIRFRLRIYNHTDAAAIVYGFSEVAGINDCDQCSIRRRFTLAATKVLSMDMFATAVQIMGVATSISGVVETYAALTITKIG